jgi:hypothetical protein
MDFFCTSRCGGELLGELASQSGCARPASKINMMSGGGQLLRRCAAVITRRAASNLNRRRLNLAASAACAAPGSRSAPATRPAMTAPRMDFKRPPRALRACAAARLAILRINAGSLPSPVRSRNSTIDGSTFAAFWISPAAPAILASVLRTPKRLELRFAALADRRLVPILCRAPGVGKQLFGQDLAGASGDECFGQFRPDGVTLGAGVGVLSSERYQAAHPTPW